MEISLKRTQNPKPKPDETRLGFGQVFTDHMFNMDYNPKDGWHNPRIEPYAPISLDPATMFLHYGQGIFEGLKAYRTPSGGVQLFRPEQNFRRFNQSAKMLCIPELDAGAALNYLKQLLSVEAEWVPKAPGTSLYIRPTIIATDPFLGVRASMTYRFFIILSPVGAYYAEGFNPVKIMVTTEHVRATPKGIGAAKTPANYAASLLAGERAHKEGFTQVLWLDGLEQKYIEEVGSMNIFFRINDELITPMLTGSILPGVTRDSVLALARHWNMKVTERRISIDEVLSAHDKGQLQEVFGSGTAAVISPVGELRYQNRSIQVGDGKVGPMANRLFSSIMDIQYGRAADPFGWIVPVAP